MEHTTRTVLHAPVLRNAAIELLSPIRGNWVDCTLGAGGFTNALLEAGASHVFCIDCDPDCCANAAQRIVQPDEKFTVINDWFGNFDRFQPIRNASEINGIVFDLGVSSMQLDQGQRGFSVLRNGPLDMRMSSSGISAADIINSSSEQVLAALFRDYGEERAARRISKRIVKHRSINEIRTTGVLAKIIESCVSSPRKRRVHPATKCFQALRISVNDELGQLVDGLEAAERVLEPGGKIAVITFHSLEDRIVKRFLQPVNPGNSRYVPANSAKPPRFEMLTKNVLRPTPTEVARNPRARSAKLRAGIRTGADAARADRQALGVPRNPLRAA